jgi:hypothetical protein
LEEVLSSPQEVAQKFSATLAGVTDRHPKPKEFDHQKKNQHKFRELSMLPQSCQSAENFPR